MLVDLGHTGALPNKWYKYWSTSPLEGVGYVTPSQFGATGSMDDNDGAAIQLALDSPSPVKFDKWYRTTDKLTVPAGKRIWTPTPTVAGIVFDMSTGLGMEIAGNCRIDGLGAKSVDFLASAIADNSSWDLYSRAIRLTGDGTYLDNVYLYDLAGGLDVDDQSDITIGYLRGENLRSRYGWATVFHATGSLGGVATTIDGLNCDRFIEPEDGTKNWTFNGGTAENIYPPGYTGQPADGTGATNYNTGTYVIGAHSHSGEGACDNIVFRDFDILTSLGGVRLERSTGSNAADLPANITVERVTVTSPKKVDRSAFGGGSNITFTPWFLQGDGIAINDNRLSGTGQSQLSRIIHTQPSSDEIVIDGFTADANSYHGRLVEFDGPNSTLQNATINQQAGTSTAILIDVDANDCKILGNTLNGPKYHSVLYDFAAGTSGCERKLNVYTPPVSNPPTAIVNVNGTIVDETGGNDDS